MEFTLSDETRMLQESARRYLTQNCPPSSTRELLKSEKGFSESVWKKLAELGWLGLIYNEKYGGSGGSFFDLMILFEEMGRVLLPSPFFCSAVLSGMVIEEAGDETLKEAILPDLIQGHRIWTLALLNEKGEDDSAAPDFMAEKSDQGGYSLDGVRLLVPYAQQADEILVCANTADFGPTLFRSEVGPENQNLTLLDTMTGEKLYAVTWKNTPVSAESMVGQPGQGRACLDRVMPRATVLKCGEMLGGLTRVLEMTVEYMKERHQFGRPLGSLQAVQHLCADLATLMESSRLIVYQAASFLSEGRDCPQEIAMAKAWLNESYKKGAWIAHQLHGGIGFTEEHDLHLYYKHAKASELSFGNTWLHQTTVAETAGF